MSTISPVKPSASKESTGKRTSLGKVDLHIHTTASDGRFTPAEIVQKASAAGLVFIAITDHDSVDGVLPAQEAARHSYQITVIGGVEINTDVPTGELHILGYGFDTGITELKTTLERLRHSRIDRAIKMIAKLRTLGVNIDYQRVRELAGAGSMGRPHIAQALLEKGYINTFKEAFLKYIGRGGPAYVERDKITAVEATQLITRVKGIPVLAHPFTCENPESIISDLKPAGLMGIEVFYDSYTPGQIQDLLKLAKIFDLIPTGGSDFHGLDMANEPPLGTVGVPLEAAEGLLALMEKTPGA
jgi:predicted metal-dependent phosphoesterase TrpH